MKNIVVTVDFSDTTESVIENARAVARAFGSRLTLIHVTPPEPDFVGFEPGPQTVRDHLAEVFHGQHKQLQDLATRLRSDSIETKALLVQGPTVETIMRESEALGADLIVVGSHGHGAIYDLLLGSISEGVVRRARCPVLIVPSPRG